MLEGAISMTIYRKIYEQTFGPIPKDDSGRSYDIHHIDGNRKNNDPTNLIALSIKDHYDIHYQQGDYGACWLISRKMKLTPEELSTLAKLTTTKRIEEGTHPFLKRQDGSSLGKDSILRQTKNGTNAFFGGEVQRQTNIRRVQEGTHHLLSGEIQRQAQQKLVQAGRHHLQGNGEFQRNVQKTLIENGTHHFLTNHPNKIQVTCPHCNKSGGKTNMQRYHFDKCKFAK
jgi:hypothetical protein